MPLLICKLLGGIMAAIGLPGAVFVITRKTSPSLPEILPYILPGLAGIFIFNASSRALAKRGGDNGYKALAPKDKKRMSIIAWLVLLTIAAVFLFVTFIITK